MKYIGLYTKPSCRRRIKLIVPSMVARYTHNFSPGTGFDRVGRVDKYLLTLSKACSHFLSHSKQAYFLSTFKKGRLLSADMEMNLDKAVIRLANLCTSCMCFVECIFCKAWTFSGQSQSISWSLYI